MVSATETTLQATGSRPPAERGTGRPATFRCPNCKQEYGDPLYHGPVGHAPQEMCFDCWASEWGAMAQVIARGRAWQPMDAALFLLCQGFSHREAADAIGIHRNTIFGWLRELRRRPHLTPEWLLERIRSRGKRR